MKLEPVYLLAPEPDQRIKLSRRAFAATILGSCLTGAAAGGVLVDGWLSQGQARNDSGTPAEDLHLRWALDVARGTDAQVANAGHAFLRVLRLHPNQELLRQGALRLAEQVIGDRDRRDRMSLAAGLLAIDGSAKGDLFSDNQRIELRLAAMR